MLFARIRVNVQCQSIISSIFRKHEWFQKDLPAYLFPSPVEQDSSVIDTDAVAEVCEVRKMTNTLKQRAPMLPDSVTVTFGCSEVFDR